MAGGQGPRDVNSINDPDRIVPVETTLKDVSEPLKHTMPGYSIEVIEFDEE
jgi:alpha-L-arabinofuranosidase